MADHSILFSEPMVRAILAGRKTQTRRVLKPQPYRDENGELMMQVNKHGAIGHSRMSPLYGQPMTEWVKWQPGSKLRVRETWAPGDCDGEVFYRATIDEDTDYSPEEIANIRWRPSIHMPRWASRITLLVEAVRVERLQEINRGDAMSEGCPFPNMAKGDDPREWFRGVWNSIHGPDAWDANPYVSVTTFRRIEP